MQTHTPITHASLPRHGLQLFSAGPFGFFFLVFLLVHRPAVDGFAQMLVGVVEILHLNLSAKIFQVNMIEVFLGWELIEHLQLKVMAQLQLEQ